MVTPAATVARRVGQLLASAAPLHERPAGQIATLLAAPRRCSLAGEQRPMATQPAADGAGRPASGTPFDAAWTTTAWWTGSVGNVPDPGASGKVVYLAVRPSSPCTRCSPTRPAVRIVPALPRTPASATSSWWPIQEGFSDEPIHADRRQALDAAPRRAFGFGDDEPRAAARRAGDPAAIRDRATAAASSKMPRLPPTASTSRTRGSRPKSWPPRRSRRNWRSRWRTPLHRSGATTPSSATRCARSAAQGRRPVSRHGAAGSPSSASAAMSRAGGRRTRAAS